MLSEQSGAPDMSTREYHRNMGSAPSQAHRVRAVSAEPASLGSVQVALLELYIAQPLEHVQSIQPGGAQLEGPRPH